MIRRTCRIATATCQQTIRTLKEQSTPHPYVIDQLHPRWPEGRM